MMNKQHFLSRWKERGNIFFTLFAAVGVVGAIGVGSTTLLKGPVQTMVKINQKQVTEDYSELGLRVMMANVLQVDANCDSDNHLEAAEWEDPTPPFTAPTGGGVFPSTYGTKVTDPWGRRLGYCVWDHDVIDDAGCGGAAQKRLRGAPTGDATINTEPFITVISSGPNQVFETSCADYVDTTPADGSPDSPLLVKPANSDDLIVSYSTIDAQQAMGDNWVFNVNETVDGDAATTDQNLDFTGDVTVGGVLDLAKLGGGLILPDFAGATCDGTTEGQMFRDSATNPPAIMVCNSGTWDAMSGSSGGAGNYAYNFDPKTANCTANNGGPFVEVGSFDTPGNALDVWKDDNYVYVADNTDGVRAYSFNGTTFIEEAFYNPVDDILSVWGDGTYIYIGDNSGDLRALSFDGSSFTEEDLIATGNGVEGVWGDGTYIYAASKSTGVVAYSFDGTSFTLEDTYNTSNNAIRVWGDGTYIYVADENAGIVGLTFDGTSFTLGGTYDTTGRADDIWGDGTYIYVADSDDGILAFSFDGSVFTLEDTYNTSGSAVGVWGDGVYIYIADSSSGVHAFSFDGSSFTLENTFSTPDSALKVWTDGRYVYVADRSSGVRAYSGFECLSTTPDYSDRPDSPNTGVDYNYRAYAWGNDDFGELGNGATTGNQVSPVLVLENNEFYKVSAYTSHACGLKTDGSAWCWGDDTDGRLGNGDTITAQQDTPYPVSGNHAFIDIDTGREFTCALEENGTIWCWGSNVAGQLGNGTVGGSSPEPTQVINITDFIQIGLEKYLACGLRRNGEVYCWGENNYGQLGNGTSGTNNGTPGKVQTSIPFISIATGYENACALTDSGEAWCWGRNNQGQIGNGSIGGQENSPVKVLNINDFIQISASFRATCGLRENGEVWCWGNDTYGQLGNGAAVTGNQSVPTKVENITDFIRIETGARMACGIVSMGEAYCWGEDDDGELGNGAGITGNQEVPTLVENLNNITDISCHNGICIAATKTLKQAPETAPTAPVIIEQSKPTGNTVGSHGLAINYNTAVTAKAGLAFKIDAEDTLSSDDSSVHITSRYGASRGLKFNLYNGTSYETMSLSKDSSLNLNSDLNTRTPKLTINNKNSVGWSPNRFDTGFLISDLTGANNSAYYGIDSTTGNAVILSGEDLLIQHSTTDGTTLTTVASFVNAGVPEFYGDIFMSGDTRTVTVSTYTNTADETAAFKFLRYRGTEGAPSVAGDEDYMGTIAFKGFDGTDYNANGIPQIISVVADPPAAGNVNSRIAINKKGSGTKSLIVWGNGNIGINSPSTTSSALTTNGRTTADDAVKAGLDPTCTSANDEGTLRFTGTEYEYCKDDGGGGYFWESVVADPTCEDDATFVDISMSRYNTCATLSNGQSVCWGSNARLQVGTGETANPVLNLNPIKTHKATQTAIGHDQYACAITDNERIKCWGRNANNRHNLGTGYNMAVDFAYPTFPATTKAYKKVSIGWNHACAIRTDGRIDCWGSNGLGSQGMGDTIGRNVPTENPYVSNIIDITAGLYHTCALHSDRTVSCWGENDAGQLGLGTETAQENSPQSVSITDVVQISAGGRQETGNEIGGACAVKIDGTVWCWGDNTYGQIGNGTSGAANVTTPTQVTGITTAIQVSRQANTVYALLENGTVQYWGQGNGQGQSTTPTDTGATNVAKLGDGPNAVHMCWVLQDGRAQCLGTGGYGVLGQGTTVSASTPVDVINPLSCNSEKLVFVTSDTFNANLGGLKGADNICQASADRANLPGRYLAWIANDKGSPSTRFNRVTTDYILVDGTIVANGWNDLTDGNIDNPINVFEGGTSGTNIRSWTATTTDGKFTDTIENCNNWTSDNPSIQGEKGVGDTSNSQWANNGTTSSSLCSQAGRLYCFQQ